MYRRFSKPINYYGIDQSLMQNVIMILRVLLICIFIGSSSGIQEGPRLLSEPPAQVFFSNIKGVELSCTFKGSPTPSIVWLTSGGSQVHPVEGVRNIMNDRHNSTLKLYDFKPEQYRHDIHVTTYRCQASNVVGTIISRPVAVQAVVVQPFEVAVSDTPAQVGDIAVFKCEVAPAVARHVRIISWNVAGRTIRPSLYPDGRFWMLPSEELIIRNVMQSDSYARISCTASHKFHPVPKMSNAARIIISSDRFLSRPQLLVMREWLKKVEGEDLIIPCLAKGHPKPTVTWFKETENRGRIDVNLELTSGRIRIVDGQLVVSPTQPADSGFYSCIVNNTAGSDSTRVELSVRSPLKAVLTPEQQRVDLYNSASLTCEVKGSPVTSVTWYKNGKQLSHSSRVTVYRRTIHLNQVTREDGGMYQCIVRNEDDAVQATAQVNLGDSLPILEYQFISQTLQPGPDVKLKCVAVGSPSPRIIWSLDGFDLLRNERLQVGQYVDIRGRVIGHVNISSVRSEDGGSYTCIARNRAGSVRHTAQLNVYGPPYVRPMPTVNAVAGESLYIKCPASGHPLAKITWEKENRHLPFDGRQSVHQNGTLIIKQVQKSSDSGHYSCSAYDKQGRSHSGSVNVQVLVPPNITPFYFGEASAGDRIRVVCSIRKGDAPLSITWYKDRLPINNFPLTSIKVREIDEYSSSLLLEDVHETHSGNYSCLAKNAARSVSHEALLSVKVPPSWTQSPKDMAAIWGENIVIPCTAKGFPLPKITWRRTDASRANQYSPIHGMSGSKMHSSSYGMEVASNGSLILRRTSKTNAGQYICEASNGVGASISALISLSVHEPPKFDTSFTQQLSVRRGTQAVLECQASGDRPINLKWKKDHQTTVERSIVRQVPDGIKGELKIRLTTAKDAGTYLCLASNDYGTDTFEIRLIIQDVPRAPFGLKVDERNSRDVTISWLIPKHMETGPIDKYLVQYRKEEGSSWTSSTKKEVLLGNDPIYQLRTLNPSTSYLVRILAENQIGTSLPSEALKITTKGEPPSAPPVSVKADAMSSSSIKVSWKDPPINTHHGLLLGYKVGIRSINQQTEYNYTVVGSTIHEELITGLKPWTQYSIVVKAYNAEGSGPLSGIIVTKTLQDVPSEPPKDITCSEGNTPSTLSLRWNPPQKSAINGILQGYKLVLNEIIEDDAIATKITHNTLTSSELVTGLKPFSNYSVVISAKTHAGYGIYSSEIICSTKEDIPTAPELKVLQSGEDSILLTWLPPVPPRGSIIGYVIYHRGPYDQNTLQTPLPAYMNSYTAKRLPKGSHKFWILAKTKIGEGNPSSTYQISLKNKFPVAIASIGRKIVSQEGEDLILKCQVVSNGIVVPTWTKNDLDLKNNQRLIVEDDGSLRIHKLYEDDSGNYSCFLERSSSQQNILSSSSKINYNLLVQVTPSPPNLKIEEVTTSSISVSWTSGDTGGAVIRAWNIWWRSLSGSGTWRTVELARNNFKFDIKELQCGSEYQIYATSRTKVGVSPPSLPMTISTKGGSPIPPPISQIASANNTNVRIWMGRWSDGGCPVQHFTLEIKYTTETSWTILASNLAPHEYYDFNQGTDQDLSLRLTAHNIAGETISMLRIRGNSGVRVIEGGNSQDLYTSALLGNPRLLASVAASFLALILTITAIILCLRKRTLIERSSSNDKKLSDDSSVDTKVDLLKQRDTYSTISKHQTAYSDLEGIPEYSEDIYPYATFQLGDRQYTDTKESNFQTFISQDSKFYGITEAHPPSLTSCSEGDYAKVGAVVRPNVVRTKKAHRNGLRSESEEYDTDSDTDMIISSRTESSNQLDLATFAHENPHSVLALDSARLASLRSKNQMMHHHPTASTNVIMAGSSSAAGQQRLLKPVKLVDERKNLKPIQVDHKKDKNVAHNLIYQTESSCTSTESSPTIEHMLFIHQNNIATRNPAHFQETCLTFPQKRNVVGEKLESNAKQKLGKGHVLVIGKPNEKLKQVKVNNPFKPSLAISKRLDKHKDYTINV